MNDDVLRNRKHKAIMEIIKLEEKFAALRERITEEIDIFSDMWSEQENTQMVRAFITAVGMISGLPTTKEILDAADEMTDGSLSGVYFLLQDDEVVYVGQSLNVYARLNSHLGQKEFNRFAWVQVEPKMLLSIEKLYIDILDPKLNVARNLDASRYVKRKFDYVRVVEEFSSDNSLA